MTQKIQIEPGQDADRREPLHRRTTRVTWGVSASLVATVLVLSGCAATGSDPGESGAEARGDMILATTTSTQDSGLLDEILPDFEEDSECVPKTVAVGSGQAMAMGETGDADVLLVHSPDAEEQFMAEGHGVSRDPVMQNDFVLVGPPDDPANVADADDAAQALMKIAQQGAQFASRGDDSGTHAKELDLWEQAGIEPNGPWYFETGQGMGETLTIANQKQAYTLADRGTFLATSSLESEISSEGSDDLINSYHVIVVEGEGLNTTCAQAFSEWVVSPGVQDQIAEFGTAEYGEPLFFPTAAS